MLTKILIGVIAVLVVVLVILVVSRPKVVELTDDLPNGDVARYGVMKFQNELSGFIKQKDGKMVIKVVKW